MIMRHWVLSSMAAVALLSTGVARAGDLHIRIILAGQIAPGVYGQVDDGRAGRNPAATGLSIRSSGSCEVLAPVLLSVQRLQSAGLLCAVT